MSGVRLRHPIKPKGNPTVASAHPLAHLHGLRFLKTKYAHLYHDGEGLTANDALVLNLVCVRHHSLFRSSTCSENAIDRRTICVTTRDFCNDRSSHAPCRSAKRQNRNVGLANTRCSLPFGVSRQQIHLPFRSRYQRENFAKAWTSCTFAPKDAPVGRIMPLGQILGELHHVPSRSVPDHVILAFIRDLVGVHKTSDHRGNFTG